MNIIQKIKDSVEIIGMPFYYASPETLNNVLDVAVFPCALCALVEQGAAEDVNGRYHEKLTLVVSFANQTDFNFNALENEDIIDECKKKAFEWLTRLRTNRELNLIGLNSTTRDYLDYDAIITGFGVNVTISEVEGFGACDIVNR